MVRILRFAVFAVAFSAFAHPGRTVRVSFYAYPGCHGVAADGTKSGYGYDFMEMLAAKAGWKVEYVGYGRPWGDMLAMMDRGELDVVDFVGWQADRAERMLYSARPMAYAGCSIRTLPQSVERFRRGDPGEWGTVRVGVLEGDQNEQEFRYFAEDHGVGYEITRYPSEADGVAALKRGEIDLVAYDGFAVTEGLVNVNTFNPCRNHLVTRKTDAALMAEIDAAMAALDRDSPGWMARLRRKYYPVEEVVAYLPRTEELSGPMEGYLKALLTRVDEILGAKIVIRRCGRDFSDADFSVPSFACGVSFTSERAERFDMPLHSAGRRRVDMFTRADSPLTEDGLRDCGRPLRIGYIRNEGVSLRSIFERYATRKGIAFEPVDEQDEAALLTDLDAGRLDLVVRVSGLLKGLKTIGKCGYFDFFLAPTKDQKALAHSLSETLKYLRRDEPDLIYDLEERYFGDSNDRDRLVRLAAYVERGLSVRGPDGSYEGFVTDIAQTVAERAGWNLKSIPLSYPEAQRELAEGGVDLMGAAVWTPEREKVYDYSKFDVGPLYYALMKRTDGRMVENRPETWNGARIGFQRGSLSIHDLEGFLSERGVKWQAVAFNNLEEGERLVRQGSLDAVYSLANRGNRDLVPLAMLPTKLCYFCSNKRKPWIKRELDAAVAELVRENHRFIVDLSEKHLSSTRGVLSLDPDELEFVRSRRGKRVRVSFCRELAPFVTVDRRSGKIGGLYRRMFDGFSRRIGLEFDYAIGDHGAEVMLSADGEHEGHEKDLADREWFRTPVCWVKRQRPLPAESKGVVAVVDDGGKDADFARRSGYRTRVFGTREECYRAVADGSAETTIDYQAVARYLLDERKWLAGLDHLPINPAVFGRFVTFYSRTTTDPRLRTILGKARDSLSSEAYDTMLFESIYAERPTSVNVRTALTVVSAVVLIALLVGFFLLHNAKVARAANEAKTQFLFNMSHDIRTPMNAIKGFTEIAGKKVKSIKGRVMPKEAAVVSEVEDCLEKIDVSGTLLLSLINNVLDMSRIESGKMKLNEIEADVFDSFLGVETIMTEQAKGKDISISFEFGPVADRYVYADCDRGTRIFVNLISNAIKYTKTGGRVRVTCEQVGAVEKLGSCEVEKLRSCEDRTSQPPNLPTSQPPNARLARYRYTFEDNGIGMSEEFQEHLFEQFSRERNSTTSGIQGTGLGLAITKKIVELMGGTIVCRSKQGEGTKFTVELPFRVRETDVEKLRSCEVEKLESRDGNIDGDSKPLNLSTSQPLNFHGKRVLLVEDNELNREVATFVLMEQGFEVEAAEDGSVAVKLVKNNGLEYYDYVLMDIQMPIMGGYEATRAIRAWEEGQRSKAKGQAVDGIHCLTSGPGPLTSHLPIIALSANAFAEDRAASIAAGMDDHVAKPIKVSELMTVLAKFV